MCYNYGEYLKSNGGNISDAAQVFGINRPVIAREHSSPANQTLFDCLKQQAPHINEAIRYVQPILLDTASVRLGPWSEYNVLTQNQSCVKPQATNWPAG